MESQKASFVIICWISYCLGLPTGCKIDVYDGLNRTTCRYEDFSAVPKDISRTTEYLDLSFNEITVLRKVTEDGLPALKRLYLSNNKITNLDNANWKGLSSLTYLYLHYNKITNLNNANWDGLSSLTYLSLYNNNITSLTHVSWKGLTGLKFLYLSDNQITNLDSVNWEGLTSLTKLSLSSNNIETLHNAKWTGLISLSRLDIRWNPVYTLCHHSLCLIQSLVDKFDHCDIQPCEARPNVSVTSTLYNSIVGDQLVLECIVEPTRPTTDKMLLITWMHNETHINTGLSKYRGGTPATPSLTIISVQLVDAGLYRCGAHTTHGYTRQSKSIHLTVETAKINGNTGTTMEYERSTVETDVTPINTTVWISLGGGTVGLIPCIVGIIKLFLFIIKRGRNRPSQQQPPQDIQINVVLNVINQ